MRVFVLEDNDQRVIKFRRSLVGHCVDYADNVVDGKAFIEQYQYDLIFLDHDLGGKEMVSSDDPNTGYQMACLLAENDLNKDAAVVIHTCNPNGASRMEQALSGFRTGLAPFLSLSIKGALEWAAP